MKSQISLWTRQIKSQSWIWPDTYSIGNLNHLKTLLNEIIPSDTKSLYGTHFIFNNQSNSLLGKDGYDNYQAPMSETGMPLFLRRMWVSGLLEYNAEVPKVNDEIKCTERINSVRTVADSVFITIGREFTKNDSHVMKEVRTLVYTNTPFQQRESGEPIASTDDTLYSQRFTLSLNDVMRFSYLSYNLHKIHYDAAYCRTENLANVVASGPFLVLLMLHYFTSLFPHFRIKSFKYRNSEPCYIDNKLEALIRRLGKDYEVFIGKDGRKLCGGKIVGIPT